MVSLERSALVRKCSALTRSKESLDSVFALVDGKVLTVMDDRFCRNKSLAAATTSRLT